MDRLKDKVAIITGGAMGIGRATAKLFAREGATVAIVDIADKEGEAAVNEIRRSGGRAEYWHMDVGNEPEVQRVFGEVKAKLGKIDILFNNAGIPGVNKPTHELTADEWNRVMAIDLNGVFFCTKHVIPHLKANGGGSIIDMSSMYGLIGQADDPAYHAAKAAVRMMAKNDATIYAADKIRVNSVHPGYIWTDLVDKVASGREGGAEGLRKMIGAKTPLGYPGKPENVAYGILFLASDESSYITGTELVIDGGYTAQ